jgi:hypothetical protein
VNLENVECYPPRASFNVRLHAMEIQFTSRVFKEGRTFVAHALELDLSSCGGTKERALKNLKAERMGTLKQILQEAGYNEDGRPGPEFISVQRVTLPLALTKAKA